MVFRPDGRALAAGPANHKILVKDLADPENPAGGAVSIPGVRSVLSPDGRRLAVRGLDGAVAVWDVSDPAHPVAYGAPLPGVASPAAFSPDGRMLITGDNDKSTLWDLSDPARPVARATDLPAVIVLVAAFSPDGRSLATSNIYDFQGKVSVWDVSDPRNPAEWPVPVLVGDASGVTSAAFAPGSRVLATGRANGAIVLWDVTDRAKPTRIGQPMVGPTDPNGNVNALSNSAGVLSMAFSADGHTLVSTNQRNTLILWDVTDNTNPHQLDAPLALTDKWLFQVSFAPDGRTLATVDTAGTGTLWDLTGIERLHGQAVERACDIVRHSLDQAEWKHFVPGLRYHDTCA